MHRPDAPLDRKVSEALRRLAGAASGADFWVYAIRDPSTGDPFFVGQTKFPHSSSWEGRSICAPRERRPQWPACATTAHPCQDLARMDAVLAEGENRSDLLRDSVEAEISRRERALRGPSQNRPRAIAPAVTRRGRRS